MFNNVSLPSVWSMDNSQDWAGQKWSSRGLVTIGCDMMAFRQDHGPNTCPVCCSESSWGGHLQGVPFPAFFTMPCSASAMMIFPTSMSTSMPPRNTPKTSGSGSHLCHIRKLFLCVFLCAWVPGNKGGGSLDCAGGRSKGKRGEEGRRDNASFHLAPPCTTVPAQAEKMFKTHLSHRCNDAKIGDF